METEVSMAGEEWSGPGNQTRKADLVAVTSARYACHYVLRVLFAGLLLFFVWQVTAGRIRCVAAQGEPTFQSPRLGADQRMSETLALLGIQMMPYGQVYTFNSHFDQIFMVPLPSLPDYMTLVDQLDEECQGLRMMNVSTLEPQLQILTSSVIDFIQSQLITRCSRVTTHAKKVSRSYIQAAFADSLPRPVLPYDENELMTGFTQRKTGQTVRKVQHTAQNEDTNTRNGTGKEDTKSTNTSTIATATPFDTNPTSPRPQSPIEVHETNLTIEAIFSPFDPASTETPPPSVNAPGKRKKRELITIVTVSIIALLAVSTGAGYGYALGRNSREEDLDRKIEVVSRVVEKAIGGFSASERDMLGILDLTAGTLNKSRHSINEMQEIQHMFAVQLNNSAIILNKMTTGNALSHQVILGLIQSVMQVQRLENLITQLKHKIRDVETAIIQLKSGYLPSTLVSYKKLERGLREVQKTLPPGLVLGIPLSDIEMYYTMPLSSFKQLENRLLIRTVIPLSEIYDKDPLFLVRPVYHPFPPPPRWTPKFNASRGFVQLVEKDALWAFKGRRLEWVVESKYLTCEARGDWRICYTFMPKFQTARTPCVERLVREQFAQIAKYCKLEFSPEKIYKPIPVSHHEYIIHRHDSIRYFQACTNDTGMHSIEMNKAAMRVRLGFNCSFLCNGKDYFLPGPKHLDSVNTVLLSGPIVQKDEEFDSLSKVVTLEIDTLDLITETQLESKPLPETPLLSDPLTADLQVLKVRVQRSLEMAANASRELKAMPSRSFQTGSRWQHWLQILESLIFFTLALFLLLAAVRSGLYLCVAPVTFSVLSPGADAFPITDATSFPWTLLYGDWIPFEADDVLNFMPVIKLSVFFLISTLR